MQSLKVKMTLTASGSRLKIQGGCSGVAKGSVGHTKNKGQGHVGHTKNKAPGETSAEE